MPPADGRPRKAAALGRPGAVCRLGSASFVLEIRYPRWPRPAQRLEWLRAVKWRKNMKYVEGFVAAVPASNKDAYSKHAAKSAPLFADDE